RAQVAALCGLAPEALMVCCTHTHSGPDTLDWYDFAPVDQAWLATLLRQLAGCVWLASQRLRPVRAERVEGTLPVGINRRQRGDGGLFIGEDSAGVYDDSAVALRLVDEAGALYASVISAGTHPVAQGFEVPEVSADWPGVMCRMVERELGGTCLFINGACGDINPRDWGDRGPATMRRIGTQAGGAALELLSSPAAAADTGGAGVAAKLQPLRLPHQDHPYLQNLVHRRLTADDGMLTEVQALRIGPVGFVGLPGEVLTETGWAVQRATRLPGARIAGYANDYVGYLPLPHIYEAGGYEPQSTMLPPASVLEMVDVAVATADAVAPAEV
ncbi:MAG TPA: hypothetical protein DCZ72_00010, partial [Armatimonadetes bacterium]|nr:hypothetical protein [Armatimonadota bacterium]